MKAVVKYLTNETEKEISVENFKSVYVYEKNIEVKGMDEAGIESNVRIPKENLVSINIK